MKHTHGLNSKTVKVCLAKEMMSRAFIMHVGDARGGPIVAHGEGIFNYIHQILHS
jgi:hypothetical protein